MSYWPWTFGLWRFWPARLDARRVHLPDKPHQLFAKNLRVTRLSKQLSQEGLAHRCSLHPTEVSRLERAVREPRLSTIVRLARALEVTPASLLEGIE